MELSIKKDDELTITFDNIRIRCDGLEYADSKTGDIVSRAIDAVTSGGLTIDRTFVTYPNTKYRKTFLTDEGWRALRRILDRTTFRGERPDERTNDTLFEAYSSMIAAYVEELVLDTGADPTGLELDVYEFDVSYAVDTYREYERYPGRWQTWKRRL